MGEADRNGRRYVPGSGNRAFDPAEGFSLETLQHTLLYMRS